MPTYLADDSSTSADVLHLHHDHGEPLGLGPGGKDRTTATVDPVTRPRSSTFNDSLDEGSTSSGHGSESSDASATPTNGGTRPTSMSSLPNGKVAAGGVDEDTPGTASTQQNGAATMVLADRTAAALMTNGAGAAPRDADSATASPTEPFPKRTSISSLAAGSIQQSPIEYYQKPVKGLGSGVDGHPSSSAPATGLATPAPSLTPVSPSPDPARRTHSPHRFSSPPLPTSSATSSLHPPTAGLKHRHTLEVPKLPAGRSSRDGIDQAYASGRFSPTTAATGARRASLSLVRRNTRSLQSEAARDEIIPDDDALRWAEAYRQKRASKRKRREEEDDDRVLVGTKVDEHHANWVTAYNMLTGIRVSVSRTNAKLDRPLTDADFEAKQKSTFDIAGNELVPSAKYDFKFKDYAPWVFRHLRALFRLDPADYLMSLTGKYILSELGSPGKSGSFFYFSRDYKYIIKTIHHAEHKFLRKILKDYYQHVTDNPNTLLSQFYGLHRVKMPYGKKIHFVVMNNLFPPHRDIHQTFDLKGSTIGRDYHEEGLEKNPRATLKDLNWLRRQRHLELGLQKKRLFLEQLQKDVQLLKRLQIMDYSLLIGIHDLQRGNDENLRDKTLKVFNPGGEASHDEPDRNSVLLRTPSKLESARKARELRQMIRQERPVPMGQTASRMPDELDSQKAVSVWNQDDGGFRATHEDNAPADEIYYLGVIDCLTHYGMIKKIEHFWKGLSNDRTQISALPPEQYGDRFYHFVEGITLSQEEAAREALVREQAAAAQAVQERERVTSWNSSLRRKSVAAPPPMPNYQPPPPPSSSRSPEALATVERASEEARRTEKNGAREDDIPERTLGTLRPGGDRRESLLLQNHEPILPVVEEAAEAASTGGRSGVSRDEDADGRPVTPARITPPHGHQGPPTPPKDGYLKPESADSGYGGLSNGMGDGSPKVRARMSRESLNKQLPPLPRIADGDQSVA